MHNRDSILLLNSNKIGRFVSKLQSKKKREPISLERDSPMFRPNGLYSTLVKINKQDKEHQASKANEMLNINNNIYNKRQIETYRERKQQDR